MLNYLQIKVEGDEDSAYRKLRVIFGSTSYPYSMEQGRTVERTDDGHISKQVGPAYKYWYGNFRVQWFEEDGYATLEDLFKWMCSENPAEQRLIMRPYNWTEQNNTTYDVTFLAGSDPLPQLPLVESDSGFCLVQFRLEER